MKKIFPYMKARQLVLIKTTITNAHGVEIIRENNTLYARYDLGRIVPEQ